MRYMTGQACTTKTGPNDAKRVVWTLGELILFLTVIFSCKLMFYGKYSMYYTGYSTGWAGMTKTSPNDARCVVWALGVCFLKVFEFFVYEKVFTGPMDVLRVRGGLRR